MMIEVNNIDRKISALQEAQNAMLTLNKHLGKEYYSGDILSMISELKVDLAEIRSEKSLTF
jgi:hypothetical protein|tara:strand:+ start:139 stop:321 length:183 start_codon:yes stop_codon:yes gene_type:complete